MTERPAANVIEQNFLENYCSRHHLTDVQEITRGWSADRKYLAKNSNGEKFLLRMTFGAEKFPYKQQEFAVLKTLENGISQFPNQLI